jgi:formylglycine-generating enzyme required for sulfatase activity
VDEPLKPIGFWSYTGSDDTRSGGRLSQLRRLLADELQLRIGRRQQVHIWQDVAAIPHGADWLKEIHKALGESSFLIPIVTPAFLESEMCCQEVMRFRQREQELGRGDLIFPFRYIDVADIAPDEVYDPAVLALLNSRQWIDFAPLRHRPPDHEEVATKLAALAGSIRAALRRAVAPEPPPDKPEPPAQTRTTQPAAPRQPELPRPAVIIPPPAPSLVPGMATRDGPGPEMVLLPAGTFLMGVPAAESKQEGTDDSNARPQHQVRIARPFWLGKYPVKRGEYAAFAAETGRGGEAWASTRFPQDDRHPVVNVSHADALAYVAWLSQRTGQTYRLPSEAEWEYAARAGTTTARYWGEDAGKPGEHAHFSKTFGSAGGTCPAGSFSPNAFGLHDMLGNIWEWTADPWHSDYKGAPSDGSVWTTGGAAARVIRGGSWFVDAGLVRAACRDHGDPAPRGGNLGFRCARVQE